MGKLILVLASNSPRRRDLLALGGWNFITRPSEVDESHLPGETPGSYVLRLAESKARTCQQVCTTQEGLTILAADTAVVVEKDILGKPKDRSEAGKMLRRLRSRTHQVYTAIAILRISDGNMSTDLCVSDVPMRAYGEEEIDDYVTSGDPLDKAGAYAIQHPTFHPVERMSGCYASVMGLPLCHLTRTLRGLDITPATNLSTGCQSYLNYMCPISAAVLRGEQVG
jgi:septum formation protein